MVTELYQIWSKPRIRPKPWAQAVLSLWDQMVLHSSAEKFRAWK